MRSENDWSKLVRDFQFFIGPGPVQEFQNFLDSGPEFSRFPDSGPVLFEIFKLFWFWSGPGLLNILDLSRFPGSVRSSTRYPISRPWTGQFRSVVPCSKVYYWLKVSDGQSDWLKTYLLVCMVIINSISSRNGKIAKKSRKFGIEQK